MDGQGIRDDALEDVLSTWEETHPGKRRPHVLYLVSVGSNPSGVTMGAERRKKIYDLAVKYGKYLRALGWYFEAYQDRLYHCRRRPLFLHPVPRLRN